MTSPSTAIAGYDWLLDDFAATTAGVVHAAIVTADGLCMAGTSRLHKDDADRLAAMVAGLANLAEGAAAQFEASPAAQTVIEMQDVHLFVMSVPHQSVRSYLAVLARSAEEMGQIGFNMALLLNRVADSAFVPDARAGQP